MKRYAVGLAKTGDLSERRPGILTVIDRDGADQSVWLKTVQGGEEGRTKRLASQKKNPSDRHR